jgi:hypothetical protein
LLLHQGEVREGGGGDMVRGVKVVHGMVEAIVEGGDEGDGGMQPGMPGDVVGRVRMESMAEEFVETFTGLEGNMAVVNQVKVVG